MSYFCQSPPRFTHQLCQSCLVKTQNNPREKNKNETKSSRERRHFPQKAINNKSFSLGPQIGYLVSAKIKSDAIPELDLQDGELDAMDAYKSIDLSAKLGLGYILDNNMFFQVSYGLSISKINELESPLNETNRNSVFQLSAGYKF